MFQVTENTHTPFGPHIIRKNIMFCVFVGSILFRLAASSLLRLQNNMLTKFIIVPSCFWAWTITCSHTLSSFCYASLCGVRTLSQHEITGFLTSFALFLVALNFLLLGKKVVRTGVPGPSRGRPGVVPGLPGTFRCSKRQL